MVGGSLRVLRLLPPLKQVAMILLKVALKTKNQSINQYKSFTVDKMVKILPQIAHMNNNP
jgi:hypothetical protein